MAISPSSATWMLSSSNQTSKQCILQALTWPPSCATTGQFDDTGLVIWGSLILFNNDRGSHLTNWSLRSTFSGYSASNLRRTANATSGIQSHFLNEEYAPRESSIVVWFGSLAILAPLIREVRLSDLLLLPPFRILTDERQTGTPWSWDFVQIG